MWTPVSCANPLILSLSLALWDCHNVHGVANFKQILLFAFMFVSDIAQPIIYTARQGQAVHGDPRDAIDTETKRN